MHVFVNKNFLANDETNAKKIPDEMKSLSACRNRGIKRRWTKTMPY